MVVLLVSRRSTDLLSISGAIRGRLFTGVGYRHARQRVVSIRQRSAIASSVTEESTVTERVALAKMELTARQVSERPVFSLVVTGCTLRCLRGSKGNCAVTMLEKVVLCASTRRRTRCMTGGHIAMFFSELFSAGCATSTRQIYQGQGATPPPHTARDPRVPIQDHPDAVRWKRHTLTPPPPACSVTVPRRLSAFCWSTWHRSKGT